MAIDTGAKVVAYGWGSASAGGVPDCRLHSVALNLLSSRDCESQLAKVVGRRFDTWSMVCASSNGHGDTCMGDSGGPLFASGGPFDGRLVGNVSWGLGCGDGIPGAYSRADVMSSGPP